MKKNDFWTQEPFEYTGLFRDCCAEKKMKLASIYNFSHPFIYVEKAIELSKEIEANPENGTLSFDQNIALTKKIREKEVQALNWFIVEYSAVYPRKRNQYLNGAVDSLRKLHKKIQEREKKAIKKFEEKKNYTFQNHHNPLPSIIELSIRRIFQSIFSLHQYELNQVNWNYLSKLFLPKKPILSFQRTHKIDDVDFKNCFKTRLIDTGLLHPETDFRVFKNFFMQKPLQKKIEWLETLKGLAYFVTALKDKGIIENPGNKHWKITSEFFTQKGAFVPNLKKQNPPNSGLQKKIDSFIEDIHSNFKK